MTEKKGKVVTVRIPPELHKRAAVKLASSDLTFQAVLQRAIEDFVTEEGTLQRQHFFEVELQNDEEREWVQALLRVLRSESPEKGKTLNVLRAVLEVEPVRSRQAAKQTKAR